MSESESESPVESIIGYRVHKGKEKYLVKWEGTSETTWEPIENLFNCMDLVADYMQRTGKNKKGIFQIFHQHIRVPYF